MLTKTIGPLHFEDLEPKRFEDLVRSLLIKFKDWYKIEPTGRGGNDKGFDIRAWEKVLANTESDESEEEIKLEFEGKKWKIQCKREKRMPPSRLEKNVVESLKEESDIYGYILAAPVDFTIDSMDKFRELMKSYGVKEFFLWGKATIEDMLLLPENDNILFTFMGFTLSRQRNNKVTKEKYKLSIKNKLITAFNITDLTKQSGLNHEVILKDINNTDYPTGSKKYFPKLKGNLWSLEIMRKVHPDGVVILTGDYFGYIDHEKKIYDFIEDNDLRHFDHRYSTEKDHEKDRNQRDRWDIIPYRYKAKISMLGLIKYEDILIVDSKGDSVFNIPQLIIDYKSDNDCFDKIILFDDENKVDLSEYKRIDFFPKKFTKHEYGNKINIEDIKFADNSYIFKDGHEYDSPTYIYTLKNKYKFKLYDLIKVIDSREDYGREKSNNYFEIIDKSSASLSNTFNDYPHYKDLLKKSLNITKDDEILDIYEVITTYISDK